MTIGGLLDYTGYPDITLITTVRIQFQSTYDTDGNAFQLARDRDGGARIWGWWGERGEGHRVC